MFRASGEDRFECLRFVPPALIPWEAAAGAQQHWHAPVSTSTAPAQTLAQPAKLQHPRCGTHGVTETRQHRALQETRPCHFHSSSSCGLGISLWVFSLPAFHKTIWRKVILCLVNKGALMFQVPSECISCRTLISLCLHVDVRRTQHQRK